MRETVAAVVMKRSLGTLKLGIFFRTFTLLMLLALLLVSFFILTIVPLEMNGLMRSIEAQARNISSSVSEATSAAFLRGDLGFVVEHNMQVIQKSSNILYIIDIRHDGFSLVHTPDGWVEKKKGDPVWTGHDAAPVNGILHSVIAGKKVYHYAVPIEFSGLDWGMLHLGLSLSDYDKQLSSTYKTIFVASLLCLIIAAILSYFFARRLTGPIRSLQQVTQRITGGDFAARADISTGDEVESLALSFNTMADKMVESRNAIMTAYEELESYRKNLEDEVERRTAQLRKMNRQLEQELAERSRAERALAESEQRYRAIFETSGNPNVIAEEDTTIVMVNSAFERFSGYSRDEVEGKKSWIDFHPGEKPEILKRRQWGIGQISEGHPKSYEAVFVDKAGKSHEIYVTVGLIPGTTRSIASLLDLTDLKRLEAQLLQSQKMEAIGQLAGGVAHDFNNILTAIIGYASLLRMNLSEGDPAGAYVDPILTAAEKAAHLTQGLLAFSRKQVIAPKSVDLNEVIKKVKHLLARVMGEDIEINISVAEEPVTVFADAGQVEQILINLAANARDAMPDGGLFSVATETIVLGEMPGGKPLHNKPGRYARVSISDTGSGMSKETMDHIFEPFFTTKEVGKGTGLGLSIVYGIVKQHNGHVDVYSEPDMGTTFKIYFPLLKPVAEEEQIAQPERPVGGDETILLAEDDQVTRNVTRIILQKFGYSVIEAVDGDDALNQFRSNAERVSLVILDVIMPKKNGKAVHDEIKKFRPDMKVLFVSGYTADIVHKKGIFEDNINFISKPVVPDDLARKVRDTLDAPG